MICGMTIGFLLVIALLILFAGMAIGAIVAVVGIDAQRKLEQQGGQMTSPNPPPTVPRPPGPPPR